MQLEVIRRDPPTHHPLAPNLSTHLSVLHSGPPRSHPPSFAHCLLTLVIRLSIRSFEGPTMHAPIYPFAPLFTHLSIRPSIHPPSRPSPVHPFRHPQSHLSTPLSTSLSAPRRSIYPSLIHPSIAHPSRHPSIHPSSIHPPTPLISTALIYSPSIHLSVQLSIHLSLH